MVAIPAELRQKPAIMATVGQMKGAYFAQIL
jgi:hypothetical protein